MPRLLPAAAVALLLSGAPMSCAGDDEGARWVAAQERWARRAPGAYDAWRALADRDPTSTAGRRLAEAAALYEDGLRQLERGEPGATDRLRAGAEIAPIAPSLYLRLARACRAQGAAVRAADFYRKYLLEAGDDPQRRQIERELAEIGRELGDPFSAPTVESVRDRRLVVGVLGVLGLVAIAAIGAALGRRVRIDRVLRRHPERATSFTYLANVLRHELLKHRVTPFIDGRGAPTPAEPIERAFSRHVDGIGGALGLPRGWQRREPSFRAAARAIAQLGRAERGGPPPSAQMLATLRRLDARLIEWAALARRTRVDRGLLHGLIDSLRDERPGRELGVRVELVEPERALLALVFEHDLLLVLRNVTRNAIAQAERAPSRALRIEVCGFVDPTGQGWVRIVVHDPSSARPPAQGPADRGLGLVRDTLERYDGALLEAPPAPGFAKAVAVSLPAADEDLLITTVERRAA